MTHTPFWNHHVDILCKTVSRGFGILYKPQILPQKVFKMLYNSFVSLYINYHNIVRGFTAKTNILRIYKLILQKRGCR